MKKTLLSLIIVFLFSSISSRALSYHQNDIDSVVNIENPLNNFQERTFKISPNPSKNKLNIELPSSFQKMTLEVFDVLGKRVHASVISQLESSIDVSRWRTGVYLVKISNEKETQTKRFIKQ